MIAQPYAKLAVVGTAALLAGRGGAMALVSAEATLSVMVDAVFHWLDVNKRTSTRQLCECVAAELHSLEINADRATLASARLTCEQLLELHGISDQRFADLALDPDQAASEVLASAKFTRDEQTELAPLCGQILVCYYASILKQPAILAALELNIHRALLAGQAEDRRTLGRIEDGVGEVLARLPPEPTAPPLPHPLPPPRRLFGRDGRIAELVAASLDAGDLRPILVHGGPGIGKSALTIAALNDAGIAEAFGARRWFVELAAARDGAAILPAVGAAIGLRPGQDLPARTLRALGEAPGLLVLDNLETPWEHGGAATARALDDLGAVAGLRLVASIRGGERPGRLGWRVLGDLAPLDAAAARAMFLDVAGQRWAEDPQLDELRGVLGGVPLAIDLIARRSEDFASAAELLAEWRARRTALAKVGAGGERETDLAASIELSLASPRLSEPGRLLFRMMGLLPDGMAEPDRQALLGQDAHEALAGLTRVGLAVSDGPRLRMLAPIREHASTLVTPNERSRVTDHYLSIAEALPQMGKSHADFSTANRARTEIRNIEAIISFVLSSITSNSYSVDRNIMLTATKTADAFYILGDYESSMRLYRLVLATLTRLSASNRAKLDLQHDLAVTWFRLSVLQMECHDFMNAIQSLESSRRILETMIKEDQSNDAWLLDLCKNLTKTGDWQMISKCELKCILYSYDYASHLISTLLTEHPENIDFLRQQAVIFSRRAQVFGHMGAQRLSDRTAEATRSLHIRKKIRSLIPDDDEAKYDEAVGWLTVGDALYHQGEINCAINRYKMGLNMSLELSKKDPLNTRWLRVVALAYRKLGDLYLKSTSSPNAVDSLLSELSIRRQLSKASVSNISAEQLLSCLFRLSQAEQANGRLPEAAKHCQEALAIATDLTATNGLTGAGASIVAELERRLAELKARR